jgi:hypothetical protein
VPHVPRDLPREIKRNGDGDGGLIARSSRRQIRESKTGARGADGVQSRPKSQSAMPRGRRNHLRARLIGPTLNPPLRLTGTRLWLAVRGGRTGAGAERRVKRASASRAYGLLRWRNAISNGAMRKFTFLRHLGLHGIIHEARTNRELVFIIMPDTSSIPVFFMVHFTFLADTAAGQ